MQQQAGLTIGGTSVPDMLPYRLTRRAVYVTLELARRRGGGVARRAHGPVASGLFVLHHGFRRHPHAACVTGVGVEATVSQARPIRLCALSSRPDGACPSMSRARAWSWPGQVLARRVDSKQVDHIVRGLLIIFVLRRHGECMR